MGSNSTKSVEGGLIIDLDKSYYYPGEIIHGKIYLDILQDFETSGIELEIEVEEYTSFNELKKIKNTQNKSQIKKREGKKTLYNNTQCVFKPDNNLLQQGQYIYPFTFMLPLNMPGSFEYYDNENVAYVKYIVEVRAVSLSTKHIRNTILLVVRQPPQFFQYPTKLSDTKTISSCCCLDKGASTLNISFEKNYYCPDEKVNVICELDNTKCSLTGKCIKLVLFQSITIADKKNRVKVLSRKIVENRFESVYVCLKYNFFFNLFLEIRPRKYKNYRVVINE